MSQEELPSWQVHYLGAHRPPAWQQPEGAVHKPQPIPPPPHRGLYGTVAPIDLEREVRRLG